MTMLLYPVSRYHLEYLISVCNYVTATQHSRSSSKAMSFILKFSAGSNIELVFWSIWPTMTKHHRLNNFNSTY